MGVSSEGNLKIFLAQPLQALPKDAAVAGGQRHQWHVVSGKVQQGAVSEDAFIMH